MQKFFSAYFFFVRPSTVPDFPIFLAIPAIKSKTSAVFSSINSWESASTFKRSLGSVLEPRKLNLQRFFFTLFPTIKKMICYSSSYLTVRPSSLEILIPGIFLYRFSTSAKTKAVGSSVPFSFSIFGCSKLSILGDIFRKLNLFENYINLSAYKIIFQKLLGDDFTQLLFRLRKIFEHHHERYHSIVAIVEIPEIIVRAHLASKDRVFFPHSFFDERMSGFVDQRHPVIFPDHILYRPYKPRIVNDLFPRQSLEEYLGQKRRHEISLNKFPFLSEKETSVSVRVPSNPEISADFFDKLHCLISAFRKKRIRFAFRKIPVRLVIQLYNLYPGICQEQVKNFPSEAEIRVRDNFELFEF